MPNPEDLNHPRKNLSPSQHAMLAKLLRNGQQPTAPRGIPRQAAPGPSPLAPGQQRLWIMAQLEPENTAYNIPWSIRLKGALRIDLLERSLREIVRRHEIWRTRFVMDEDLSPVQIVDAQSRIAISLVDLTTLPPAERMAEAQRVVREELGRPFDLTADPLVRPVLIRLGADDHVFFISFHHIVGDGWSMGVFIREVKEIYAAFLDGRPSPLPELPVQYADFARWHRQALEGAAAESHLRYWTQHLGGSPPLLELPTDRPRPARQSYDAGVVSVIMPRDLTARLKELSKQRGVTLFITLMSAFQTLLHRYTGQTDILVGSPTAGRTRPETEGLIGFFVNTLVLRGDLSGNPSFTELMGRMREVSLGAFAHQDLPFDRVVEALHVRRSLSHSPLFQVTFNLLSSAMMPQPLPGTAMQQFPVETVSSVVDLELLMLEVEEGLSARFEFSTALFDEATIRRMAVHLQTLLEGIVAEPEVRLADLPLLPAEESRQLASWGRGPCAPAADACIHELFTAQAVATPDAVALRCDGRSLTYRELNEQANQVAHYLHRCGAGPERPVGICMERSAEMVIGLLGVLKAGAPYVPLDPHYPAERLAYMIRDSGMGLLLTQAAAADHLSVPRVRMISFDADRAAFASEETVAPHSGVTPGNLAYILYTSGSTGYPKGVQVEHRSVVNLLRHFASELNVTSADLLLAVTSISFDIAGLELYLPLVTGATVEVATRGQLTDGNQLANLLCECGATMMQATPATWQMLRSSGWQPDGRLKVLTGGEALPVELAAWLTETGGPVWNLYGPTETTIWSTSFQLERGSGVFIGQPITNTHVHVLDNGKNPVPIGVPGELYIGGAGVARGYLNQPALTAERFGGDASAGEPDAAFYRTGDLVRFRSGGLLEFLGRIDQQVKVRGFRIELGEIETALERHPAVSSAVASVRVNEAGDPRLAAYLVANQEEPLPDDLRRFLARSLPDYMIPSVFMVLPALPLTPNGKVDRRLLPDPGQSRQLTRTYVAPRDQMELELVQLWEEILGVRPIGVTDDFFELGGHSLLAIRLMTYIQTRYGRTLPVSEIFEGATIEQLARLLQVEVIARPFAPIVRIRQGTTGTPVFFTHPAGGNVLCYVQLAGLLGPEVPVYGIQSPPLVEGKLPFTTYRDRAAYYAEQIRALHPGVPCVLAGWCYGGVNAFAVAGELVRQGHEVSQLVLIDPTVPMYLSEEEEPGRAEVVQSFGFNLEWDFTARQKPLEELRQMTEQEHIEYLLDLARQGEYLPPDAGEEQICDAFAMWSANLKLAWKFTSAPFAGPIRLILPTTGEHTAVTVPIWRELAGGGLDTVTVPGNHYTMMRSPNTAALAAAIRRFLEPDAH